MEKLKKLIKDLWTTFRRKDTEKFDPKKKKIKYPWCIYGYKTFGEAKKSFNFVHYVLKYKILVPGLRLFNFFFGKKIDRPIPEHEAYTNLRIFEKAFDDSIDFWVRTYLVDPKREDYDKAVKKLRTGYNKELLQTMKKITRCVVTQDTAYLELLNIFMHKLAHAMYDEYKGQTVHHLFYTKSAIYDVLYARLYSEMRQKDKEDVEHEKRREKGKSGSSHKRRVEPNCKRKGTKTVYD